VEKQDANGCKMMQTNAPEKFSTFHELMQNYYEDFKSFSLKPGTAGEIREFLREVTAARFEPQLTSTFLMLFNAQTFSTCSTIFGRWLTVPILFHFGKVNYDDPKGPMDIAMAQPPAAP
jgi:hypothetical protein